MAETTFHSIKLPGIDAARAPAQAAEFNTGTAYAVKDYCTYQGVLYRCTTAHAAGAWNASHFTATNLDNEFDRKLDIPASQASAPANPRVGDLWIDNDEDSTIYNVDAQPTSGSTNAVQSGGTYTALNGLETRKANRSLFSGDYSASATYEVNQLVMNGNTLYRCKTRISTPEAWNASHWQATNLNTEFNRLRDSEADTDMIAETFGTSSSYAVGDYVVYNSNLYRCISAVSDTGSWDPDDWVQVALADDVSDVRNTLCEINENEKTFTESAETSSKWESYNFKKGHEYHVEASASSSIRIIMWSQSGGTTIDTFVNTTASSIDKTFVSSGDGDHFRLTAGGVITVTITDLTVIPLMYNTIKENKNNIATINNETKYEREFEITSNTNKLYQFDVGYVYRLEVSLPNGAYVYVSTRKLTTPTTDVEVIINNIGVNGDIIYFTPTVSADIIYATSGSNGILKISRVNKAIYNFENSKMITQHIYSTYTTQTIRIFPFKAKKGDIANIEISNFNSTQSIVPLVLKCCGIDGTETTIISDVKLIALNGRVFTFKLPVDTFGLTIGWANWSTITSENPLEFDITASTIMCDKDGIFGKCYTTKEVLYSIENMPTYNVFEVSNNTEDYAGNCRLRWLHKNTANNLWTMKDYYLKVGETAALNCLHNFQNDAYDSFVVLENPNSVTLNITIYTEEYYNQIANNNPFNIIGLGTGRSIISPKRMTYVHNSRCVCDEKYTYITYQGDSFKTIESTAVGRNNILLTIIEEGIRVVKTITLFSDRQFVETYEGENLVIPYGNDVVKIGRNLVVACYFKSETSNKLIVMAKSVDLDTWEVSSIAPTKLKYNGNTVDFTVANYNQMVNTLYGTSLTTTPTSGYENHKIVYYNGYAYTVFAFGKEHSSDVVPYVLAKSADGYTWEPIAMIENTDAGAETSIAIHNGKILLCVRIMDLSMKYGVYNIDGTVVKHLTVIEQNIPRSQPEVFVFDDQLYAIYNTKPLYYSRDVFYKRLAINVAYLSGTNELVMLKHYESEAGFQNYSVDSYGPRVRFINTEDNGGINLPESMGTQYGAGPYCQLSICGIKCEDLAIPS